MINKKIGVLLLFALLVSFGAKAQRATSMRINEVLVINEDNFVDDYGKRHAWIELFNNSAGSVNIAGCYLTNDKSNPKKYPIPKGDVLTVIPPRQHTLFWADGEPDRGTFHVNFTLDPSKENYIALYDADGRTLIDEIVIPASQKADVSYGRTLDGQGEWTALTKVTPSTNNVTLDSNEKIENFKENDSWGIGMTLTAWQLCSPDYSCCSSSLNKSESSRSRPANAMHRKRPERLLLQTMQVRNPGKSLRLSVRLYTK